MAIPGFQQFMLPLLRLAQERGEMHIAMAVEELARIFHFTDEELAEMVPSGRQSMINNRISWAKTDLVKAGLLEATKRAHFRITPLGEKVLQDQSLQGIDRKFLMQFPAFETWTNSIKGKATGAPAHEPDSPCSPASSHSNQTPEEAIHAAHAELNSALGQELLERILQQDPAFFEQLVVQLLVAMGYGGSVAEAGKALGKSGDHGVDGVIKQDELGLERIYVQAKRYAPDNTVGSPEIRTFAGSLARFKASKGLFVTTSSFSPAAREDAGMVDKRIVLIDGEQLVRLMIRHDVGCRIEESIAIKRLDEDFFPPTDTCG